MTDAPLISVIVPLHNHRDTVGEALESILEQDHRPLEVLVVDNGSTDGGGEVLAAYTPRVRLLSKTHGPGGSARNLGFEASRGELIAFFDADDLLPPGRLRRHVRALEADSSLDGVYGDVVAFREEPRPWRGAPQPARLPGSMTLRRSAVERTRFDPQARQGEVVDWVARLEEAGARLAHVPGEALLRRLHRGNHGIDADMHDYARQLKAMLDRRRAREQSHARETQ